MTGPEHYAKSQHWAGVAAEWFERSDPETADDALAASAAAAAIAQVHATLALAAATAELDTHEGPGGGSATGRFGEQTAAWVKAGAVVLP